MSNAAMRSRHSLRQAFPLSKDEADVNQCLKARAISTDSPFCYLTDTDKSRE